MYIDKGVPISTVTLGPDEALKKWKITNLSLKHLQRQENTFRNYEMMHLLHTIFSILEIEEAYAPHVSAQSANIVEAQDVRLNRIVLRGPGKKFLWRNNHLRADGLILPPGKAFIMSASGCPVLIATGCGHMIVAHAGRESLIDRKFIETGIKSRPQVSVVGSIVQKFWEYNIHPTRLCFHVMYAIPPSEFVHHLDHPIYGEYNRKLITYLLCRCPSAIFGQNPTKFHLNLGALIIKQSYDYGVSDVVVTDCLDEYDDLTYTRKSGVDATLRNLIVVKHTESRGAIMRVA